VIALDTNILVYAHRAENPFHALAAARVRDLAESAAPWAIPWPCVHEFLAICTNTRIFKTATPVDVACAQVEAWLSSPSLVLLQEGPGYLNVLSRLLRAQLVSAARVHDARIAALALYHSVDVLLTADRDFSRFPGLKVQNPLVPA